MQRALEEAIDHADYLIESADLVPPKRRCVPSGGKSIFDKLRDLYVEESGKEPEGVPELKTNVNLLEKLVMRESFACLVVTLYPRSEGYSLMLKEENGSECETICLPYKKREFLEYLDAEELPPVLIDLLEKSKVNIFYSGCVIAEILDYRECDNMQSLGYQRRHALLRPTMQTLAHDVHSITSDSHTWTQEDKLELESQLILATSEPLCLDPSIAVACTENRLLYNKQKMNSQPMKQYFKRYSRASLYQPPVQSGCPPLHRQKPFTSSQKSEKRKVGHPHGLGISEAGNSVKMWKQNPCDPAMPSKVDIEKHAEVENSNIPEDSQPTACEAREVNDNSTDCEAIVQSPDDSFCSGTTQPSEVDKAEGSRMSPIQFITEKSSDEFITGPQAAAEKVIKPYQRLVWKKRPVSAPHSSSSSASLSLSPKKEIRQPPRVLVQSPAQRKKVKQPTPPLKLPSSSGSSSSVSCSSPQQANSFLKSPTTSSVSEPPIPSQKSSVGVSQVSTLSPAAPSPATSSQKRETTLIVVKYTTPNSNNVVSSGSGAQASGSGSNPEPSSSHCAKTPAGKNPRSHLPSGVPQPTRLASQVSVPFILKDTSVTRPLTVHFIRGCQLIVVPQQQQPLSQSTPQRPIICPQQPEGQSSAQGSPVRVRVLPNEQAVPTNPATSYLEPCQPAAPPQPAAAPVRPEQSLCHQRVLISAPCPQPQPRLQQLETLQRPASVAEAATQRACTCHHQRTGSHSKGKVKKGTSASPKS